MKKKEPKKQAEEEKTQTDQFEISSDECMIQDDELDQADQLLKGANKRKLKKATAETTSIESPSTSKR